MFTLATLKQAILDYTENDDTTFVNQLDTFIRFAEERILKASQLQIFQDTQKDTVLADSRVIAKPCDWLATYSLELRLGAERTTLLSKDKTFLDTYWPDYTATDKPKYYADHSVTLFVIAPTPAVDYQVIINYLRRPQSLVDTVGEAQTWLATNAPQTLLYGALIEAYGFMKGEQEMMEFYTSRFNESILRLKNHGEALENDDSDRRGVIRTKPS